MNLVRGVALIGVASACSGAGPAPDPLNSLSEKSGGRVAIVGLPGGGVSIGVPAKLSPFVLPKLLDPRGWPLQVTPKPDAAGNRGAIPIPTHFSGHAELIPTQWPSVAGILCDQ